MFKHRSARSARNWSSGILGCTTRNLMSHDSHPQNFAIAPNQMPPAPPRRRGHRRGRRLASASPSSAGAAKISTEAKVRPYSPKIDAACAKIRLPPRTMPKSFQGKPVRTWPRSHSAKRQSSGEGENPGGPGRPHKTCENETECGEKGQDRPAGPARQGAKPRRIVSLSQERRSRATTGRRQNSRSPSPPARFAARRESVANSAISPSSRSRRPARPRQDIGIKKAGKKPIGAIARAAGGAASEGDQPRAASRIGDDDRCGDHEHAGFPGSDPSMRLRSRCVGNGSRIRQKIMVPDNSARDGGKASLSGVIAPAAVACAPPGLDPAQLEPRRMRTPLHAARIGVENFEFESPRDSTTISPRTGTCPAKARGKAAKGIDLLPLSDGGRSARSIPRHPPVRPAHRRCRLPGEGTRFSGFHRDRAHPRYRRRSFRRCLQWRRDRRFRHIRRSLAPYASGSPAS